MIRANELVTLPLGVLALLLTMSNEHVEDIDSGIKDGTYDAAANTDIERKREAVKTAEAISLKANGTGEVAAREASETQSIAISANARSTQLAELKENGLTIGECITAFAVPNDDPYVKGARSLILGGDDIEIDDNTTTSVGEDGAWVLNWLWVSNEEAGILTNTGILETVWEYACKRMSDEQGLKVPHNIAADWLQDLVQNFSDELDGIETEVLKGLPAPITWTDVDGTEYRFMPSDAVSQLRLIARENGLPDDISDKAEQFCIRYGNKLDAILHVINADCAMTAT